MDPSLLCTDNETRPPAALADCPTGDLGSSSAHSPTEKTAFALVTDAETVSELSSAADKSTETLANVSKRLSQEKCIDSDFFRPMPNSYNKSECLSFCPESTPRDDECRVYSYFGPSEPVLPLLTHDLISRHSESGLYFTEPTLSFSLMQEINTLQPVLSSTSEGVMEPFVSEAPSTCSFNSVTSLLRSFSHQSDSLVSDTATASLSDLYIFEGETPDFILSPDVDPEEIKCPRYQSLSLTGGTKDHPECYTHDSMCDSGNVVMQCCHVKEQVMLDYESGMRQHKMPTPPAVDVCEAGSMSGNDAEVTDLTSHLKRSDSPIELWLDACQYLAGEESENRGVLDNNSGPTVMQGGLTATSDLSFPTRETLVSGYSPDGGEGIGWSDDDTIGRGPLVQRWSSVDSWTTALSDWTGIITSPPQDLTAAFTEIGAEIDALTQALAEVNAHLDTEASKGGEGQGAEVRVRQQPPMGVQDHPLKAQNIPESSVLSGQRCLSLCLEAAGQELQNGDSSEKVESFFDKTPSTVRERDPEDVQSSQAELPLRPTHRCPCVGSSSAERCNGGTFPESTSAVLDLSHFGGCVESFETDIFISNEEDPVILNIIEDMDMDGLKAPTELIIEEPFADGLCEVTDENNRPVSQPVAKQDANRSLVPADRGGTKSSTDHLLATNIPTDSQVQGVDKQPGLNANAQSVSQVQSQYGSTEFIVPVAPLGVGSPLVCQTNRSFRDQTCVIRSLNDHKQSCIPWPATDEITVKLSLADNDKELINKKESSEKPSPQGPLASDTTKHFFTERKAVIEDIHELSKVLSNIAAVPSDHFFISETSRITVITLDLNDPFAPRATKPIVTAVESEKTDLNKKTTGTMPHKTHKFTSESRSRSKKEKSAGHHHGAQAAKKQENLYNLVSAQPVCKEQETRPLTDGNQTSDAITAGPEDREAKLVIETGEATEKVPTKPHSKKKKKHAQNETGVKGGVEPLVEVEKGAKPKTAKGRIDMFEAKLGVQAGNAQKDGVHPHVAGLASRPPEAEASQGEQPPQQTGNQPKGFTSPLNDDIKRRRLSEDKFGKIFGVFQSKLPKTEVLIKSKGEEAKADAGATPRKAYSDVVKQKVPPKEEPKVVKSIQVEAVSAEPQSLCLWCQFSAVFSQHTVTWSRDGAIVTEIKRSAGDESRVSLIISNASHKDLGKYQCRLTSLHGSVTLDYLLTYEVLSEIVIPPSPKTISTAPVEVRTEEEDVQCSKIIFNEDFLSDQYFGENQPVSIITEKVHFGEGMHRRAFRTKLHTGQISLLLPGHSCVLKVHNAISYGTNNNDELIQKNFTLAVEECQVQNTAREYIKAYTTAAQSFESFGEIPEIIPIYLVHRPSNDIPYATLEEELIGDFVKYSVKDGKEINLMRRDSEAGQKCCAFQHWVYHKTEGNLLVTDMQGVGMRLTDVGIATSKKGYQGFKGNCATSFIDQFKVLHQCNKYCEILGLKSLQPKAKKHASALKPKPQPSASPKKKTFGPTMKGKS